MPKTTINSDISNRGRELIALEHSPIAQDLSDIIITILLQLGYYFGLARASPRLVGEVRGSRSQGSSISNFRLGSIAAHSPTSPIQMWIP
jgi:hypothetical protein